MKAYNSIIKMMAMGAAFAFPVFTVFAVFAVPGCDETPAGRTYYERQIEPILTQFCSGNTGGCHAINPEDPFAFAAGNLDVTSFENVQKRHDLLQPSGAYSIPPLLIKGVGATDVLQVIYRGEPYPIEVQHVGGNILEPGSDAYLTLLDWMENGATENGLPPPAPPQQGVGACSPVVPVGFDATPITANPNFNRFGSDVQPVLNSCSAASCHGAPASDFYITCGEDETQRAFNFAQAQSFIDDPVDNSQILQVPLAVTAGGYFHSGGEHFLSRTDDGYEKIKGWAEATGGVAFGEGDPGKEFFAQYVQPVLLQRGCTFEGCHSPSATNDLKLRSGSQGFFSAIALEKNYDLLRNEFMAPEVPDARRGRAVSKTILGAFGGIAHRGGPVLETPNTGGANPANCPDPFDPAAANAFCVVQAWIDIERAALVAAGQVDALGAGNTVPIVYVDRLAAHVATPLEFDTYQADSDLLVVDATLDATGAITGVGAPRSLLDNCPNTVPRTNVDVRGPDVRHDGTTVTFAMRTAQAEPLSVYTVDISGANCVRITTPQPDVSGIKIHDFDPAWSPDGEYIVFASTRGGAAGPSMSRKLFLPQSDIWRVNKDGSNPEQVTFLTNSEVSPQMMREGRIIMTTEKVSEDFYQLSGRRINWDRTDYHPLLAQRAESVYADPGDPTLANPSIGYAQATEIREGFNGNFLLVLSDEGARGGAGTLAIFNRSVGPFELGRDDPGYMRSVTFPDPNASGRVGAPTSGAYRSPFPLLDGRIMVSYAGYNGDLGAATSLDWDLVAISPRTGARTLIVGGARAQVEAVLALKYPARDLYYNRRQLVFGGSVDTNVTQGEQWGVVHFPDAPMIFTLANANLRRGRPVELFRQATDVAFYQERSAPPGTTTGNLGPIYQDRVLVGSASLAADGSALVRVPAGVGVILELRDQSGALVTMREEHQIGPGEVVSLGIREELFDAVCGGCHGAVSGREIDIAVTPDALTGASASLSSDNDPVTLSP